MPKFPGIPVTTMITDLRGRLLDPSGTRYSTANILDPLNIAQRELAAILPVALLQELVFFESLTISGTSLNIDNLSRPILRLLHVEKDTGNVTCRIVDYTRWPAFVDTLLTPGSTNPMAYLSNHAVNFNPTVGTSVAVEFIYLYTPRDMEAQRLIAVWTSGTKTLTLTGNPTYAAADYYNGMYLHNYTTRTRHLITDFGATADTFVVDDGTGFAAAQNVSIESELNGALHPLLMEYAENLLRRTLGDANGSIISQDEYEKRKAAMLTRYLEPGPQRPTFHT